MSVPLYVAVSWENVFSGRARKSWDEPIHLCSQGFPYPDATFMDTMLSIRQKLNALTRLGKCIDWLRPSLYAQFLMPWLLFVYVCDRKDFFCKPNETILCYTFEARSCILAKKFNLLYASFQTKDYFLISLSEY